MKSLLIGSVYGTTPRNATWVHLQRTFFARTNRCDYDFAVVLNDVPAELFDKDVHVIAARDQNYGHESGMEHLLNYFRSVKYENYLILDSDCFPVTEGWLEVLLGLCTKFGKEVAAPVRFENLDRFAHPCAVFMTAKGLGQLPPFAYQPTTDLLGNDLKENHFGPGLSFLPLLRSNVWSPHPVWGSVYHHLFYHHGAGSRVARSRSTACGYFDHYLTADRHQAAENELFAQLCADPVGYLDRLLGRTTPEGARAVAPVPRPRGRRAGLLRYLFGNGSR
jgi:hypothetical protein